MNQDRFERQTRFFGIEGQRRLRAMSVTVVGFGGLGSHLVQQLAFLGVGRITSIDPDVVETTNLNRLIGTRRDDSMLKTPKVDVALRLVRTIDPEIQVTGIQKNLISDDAFDAMKNSDFVFGCVDNDGPRLVLTELCAAYKRPYLDLASEIIPGSRLYYGGRVCFSDAGEGCLVCLDLISMEEVQQYFLSKEAKRDRATLYGVPEDELQDSGPSVVTINGVVASLATTEFMVHVTGLRKATRLIIYRATESKVTVGIDRPRADCYYCKSLYGSGSVANVERYLSESKGTM
ncbi:MAG: ThiF family adenylyltransferase [archaeon]|nr:ThiF family adenylyltransferase [archaeon]